MREHDITGAEAKTPTKFVVRAPASAYISNGLRILSPKTWVGFSRVLAENGVDVPKLLFTWIVVFLPPLLFGVLSSAGFGALGRSGRDEDVGGVTDTSCLNRIATLSLISPLSVGALAETTPIARSLAKSMVFYITSRKRPTDDAWLALSEGIKSGRIIRKARFDLYLPPMVEAGGQGGLEATKRRRIRALIIIPGMMVGTESYASIASRLSDSGLVVAIPSMEPLRDSRPLLGGDPEDMRRIMRRATREMKRYMTTAGESSDANAEVEWSLAGHSLGGYAAMRLAPDLMECTSGKVVVWGAGSMDRYVPDLSSDPRTSSSCKVLAIQGSNDKICSFTPTQHATFKSKLPKHSILRTIKGGSHDGFASYPSIPTFDGVRDITLEEQHQLTCSETVKFLARG